MTLLKIAKMGHPVLLEKAAPVGNIDDPAIQSLIDDMIETMHDAAGVGLAAPQVYVSKRIFVYHVPKSRQQGTGDEEDGVRILINPVIIPEGDEQVLRPEGCLSIPGLRGWIPRYSQVRYEGFDRDGRVVSGIARGFHANVIQHEADHLDGILYPMRMKNLGMMGFEAEFSRYLTPETAAEMML
ncbi:peptide deformylase [Acetobacter oeni]|uniref:Peptide deformylase n=1 Tax=Acetobacter oeni TaxID=304077 RepID=A0A511XJ47_9PROT|nr:peptide deformylase [Acetobacter oeni]MBB3882705.1 peptide deformylase [Acetobacter oeni]NHO18807.1 peptide deformylase [Acetobacter oeni]GBR04233.1 peptide deformylase [Acetobacter oeni LMG 21952]GEN62958.1 peptide deformylase [Acetobacter oeni]